MIRRLQKIVKSILETSVGTRIASAWLKRSYLSKQRKRFQKYAEIKIKPIVRTLSENDDYTASFIGGTYSSSFTITSDEINRLLTIKPDWAEHDWKDGYLPGIASSMGVPSNPNQKCTQGRSGNDVYRILTLDVNNRVVYFELKDF